MRVEFFVPGPPQGKGRPRATKMGGFIKMYTPAKTVSYEGEIAFFASQSMASRELFDGPVSAVVDIAVPVPKSFSKKKREQALEKVLYPITKPDSDNVLKCIFDAINGVVWKDDTQVVWVLAKKFYSDKPGVNVRIENV